MPMNIISVLILSLFLGKASIHQQFSHTLWIAKVAPSCIDTLKFVDSRNVYAYNCELDHTSEGRYKVLGKTLTLVIQEDAQEQVEQWRYQFELRNQMLVLLSSEQFLKGKWRTQKMKFDNGYFFKRITILTDH